MHPVASVRIRSAIGSLLPREHGGWSLLLEPVVLGLLVAPSPAGVCLAGATVAAFLARRPLQILSGAARQAADPSIMPVRFALLILSGVALLLVAAAASLAGPQALWPLAFALPPAALFLWLDAQGEARAAAAEIAGALAFAVLPAAFVILQHDRTMTAFALTTVMAARSLPAVLTIRTFLRRRKGQSVPTAIPLAAGTLAVAVTIALAGQELAPWAAPGCVFVFSLRTLWLFGPRPPALRATQLGMLEAALGAAFVFAVGLTWPLD